mgnify:CR=1 FL=1
MNRQGSACRKRSASPFALAPCWVLSLALAAPASAEAPSGPEGGEIAPPPPPSPDDEPLPPSGMAKLTWRIEDLGDRIKHRIKHLGDRIGHRPLVGPNGGLGSARPVPICLYYLACRPGPGKSVPPEPAPTRAPSDGWVDPARGFVLSGLLLLVLLFCGPQLFSRRNGR